MDGGGVSYRLNRICGLPPLNGFYKRIHDLLRRFKGAINDGMKLLVPALLVIAH